MVEQDPPTHRHGPHVRPHSANDVYDASVVGTYNFSSPGPGGNIGTQQHSSFSYTFPATIVVGPNTYNLISRSPTSPFTAGDGAPAPPTTVTGNYQLEAHLDGGTQHNVTIAIKR